MRRIGLAVVVIVAVGLFSAPTAGAQLSGKVHRILRRANRGADQGPLACDLGEAGEGPQRESGKVARMSNLAELYRTVEVNMGWWFYGVNARGDNPGDERLAPGGRSYFNELGQIDLLGLAVRLRDAYRAFPFLN
jgi:hypothetical protein